MAIRIIEAAVTRAEYDALADRVAALEAALRNAATVTPVTRNAVTRDVTRNASSAERQRRYRARKKSAAL